MSHILIIGAGLSGLTAARELIVRGYEVTIVDKGRGVGGRMATRRMSGATFDHGAQFFTTRSEEFKTAVAQWQTQNVASHWFDGYPSPSEDKPDDLYPRFCGTAGMTGIGKFLARGLKIHQDEEIAVLAYAGKRWKATSRSGTTFEGDFLILTAPVPQSLDLFDSSGHSLPTSTRQMLENLRYEPCFAVLALLGGPSNIPAPGLFYVNGDPIWWIADNFQKGISALPAVTIHSSGAFARTHYDQDQTKIGQLLLEASQQWLGSAVKEFQVRRWRYSKPENPVDIGVVSVPELNLIFAGDALMGAKVEGAFLSGCAAAAAIA